MVRPLPQRRLRTAVVLLACCLVAVPFLATKPPSLPPLLPRNASSIVFEACSCTDPMFGSVAKRRALGCPMVSSAAGPVFRSDDDMDGVIATAGYMSPSEQQLVASELSSFKFSVDKLGDTTLELSQSNHSASAMYRDGALPTLQRRFPLRLAALTRRLVRDEALNAVPDHVLIRRYEPGEGVHVDSREAEFEGASATLVLGSGTAIDFIDRVRPCLSGYLPVGSLLVLQPQARRGWMREVKARVADDIPIRHIAAAGRSKRERINRGRTFLLTFRTVAT